MIKRFITPDVQKPEIQHYKTYSESLKNYILRHRRCCGFHLDATIGDNTEAKKMFYFTGDIRKLSNRQKDAILSTKWNKKLTEQYVNGISCRGLSM